jgi:Thioesterase-like superfamily
VTSSNRDSVAGAALEPFFVVSDGGLVPGAHAQGPWSAGMLHGRLLAGLAALAIERDHGVEGFVPVRLTVDMFRNPSMEPAEVTTTLVRAGGRVRAMDATVRIAGVEVARASALYLRTADAPTDDAVPVTHAWDALPPDTQIDAIDEGAAFDVVAPDGRGFDAPGRRQRWLRDRRQLVGGHELSPFVRAALVADIASPLANFGPAGLDYINADLTLHLGRMPEGEWIGVETSHRMAAAGVSVAACTLHDRLGPIGSSTVCAVRNPRLTPTVR